LLELPKGKVLAHLDTTDLFRAKDVLRGHICIAGNVPISILQTGTPADVEEMVKKQIDYAGKDGGYILSTRSPLDDARADTLKALIQTTEKYGVYR
jgi:uroporphyrinogen-III decarboxylase